jgi:hypothetical protein
MTVPLAPAPATPAPAPAPAAAVPHPAVSACFDTQVEALLRAGWHTAAGLGEQHLLERVLPLRDRLAGLPAPGAGRTAFVLVPGADVPAEQAMGLVALRGRAGYTTVAPSDLAGFRPTEHARPPQAPAYLLVDVDLGADTRGVPPEQVLPDLLAAGRSPLTVPEGVAVLLQDAALLRTESCFSLLGSRCGDRRVPALWVARGGRPRLGWCWDGAPHSWLGSASCSRRVG